MLAFLHGLRIGMGTAVLFFLPILLLGYLIRDKIRRNTTKLIWLGVQLLALGCCDIVYCAESSWDKLIPIFLSWPLVHLLLGHSIAATVQLIHSIMTKEDTP